MQDVWPSLPALRVPKASHSEPRSHCVVIPTKEDTTEEDDESAPSEVSNSDEGASCVARLKDQTSPSLSPRQELLSRLLIHDAAQRAKVFSSQQFDCGVCLTSWLGTHCVQLSQCRHVFCKTCLVEFCKVQITEGNVRKVTCLEVSCKAAPTHAQVRSVVGEELFSRYDRLLQQSSLNSMLEVKYCPRPACASGTEDCDSQLAEEESDEPELQDEQTHSGHEVEDSDSPEEETMPQRKKTYKKMPKSKEGMLRLWEDYSTGTRAHRRLLEDRYGRHVLLGFLENSLTQDWLDANTKSCPHCSTHIERIGGCVTFTCKGCRLIFCWECLGPAPYCYCSGRLHLMPRT